MTRPTFPSHGARNWDGPLEDIFNDWQDTLDGFGATVDDIVVIPGPPGAKRMPLIWQFDTPLSGQTGGPFRLPVSAGTVITGLYCTFDTAPTADLTVQLQYAAVSNPSVWTDMYNTPQTIPSGSIFYSLPVPSLTAIPADSLVRTKIISAPIYSPPTAVSLVNSTTYTSGAGTSSTPTLTIPSGGANGDQVLAILFTSSNDLSAVPSPWGMIADIQSDPTTVHGRMLVLTAPWSSGLTAAFTLTATDQNLGWCGLFRGANANMFRAQNIATDGNGTGLASTTAQLGGLAGDILLAFFGRWQGSNNYGYTSTITGSPAVTTHGSMETTKTQPNKQVGLDWGIYQLVADVTVGAYTDTLSAGTGAGSNTSWTKATLMVAAGAGTGPGTGLLLQSVVEFA